MCKNPILNRSIATIVLACFITATLAWSASAAESADRMKLHRGFLKGTKFSVDGGERNQIYGFSGLSFSPEFLSAMNECPPALKEARKSFAYNGVALAASLGMLGLSIKTFVNTMQDVSAVNSGEMVDSSFKIGDVVMLSACVLVMITAGSLGGRRLTNGIKMFNDGCASDIPPLTPQEHANSLGFRFGFNSSTLGEDFDAKTGPNAALVAPIELSRMVALQLEFAMIRKGFSRPNGKNASTSFWYLEMPLLLKVSPFGSNFRPSFFAGPMAALRLSSTTTVDGEEVVSSYEEFNVFDYGLVVGASVLIPNSPCSIDARYELGFPSVLEDQIESGSNVDYKNRTLALGLGVHF